MTRQLVIIGNGMAATRLAQALVERDAQRFSITIIGDEPGQAYNRIQLSPVLGAEKTAGETRLLPETWYQRHNVKVRAGETVTAVDIHARTLQTTAGVVSWDELVFATGSLPFVPPLPGITQPHVFAFRTLADVEGILAIDGPAVVIGGGVLGVEAAAALRRYGDSVTLLHRGSGLMEQQIDAFAGEQLQMLLAERGIRCVMESRIAAIDAHQVRLEDGRAFAASRVVLATGVQPNKRLAERSGWPAPAESSLTASWQPRSRASAPSGSAVKSTVGPGGWWRHACARRRCWLPACALPQAKIFAGRIAALV